MPALHRELIVGELAVAAAAVPFLGRQGEKLPNLGRVFLPVT